METQEVLDRLGFEVKYETIHERLEHSCRERVTAYATITRKSDGFLVAKLETQQTHLVERVVERFLDAFVQGYDYAQKQKN